MTNQKTKEKESEVIYGLFEKLVRNRSLKFFVLAYTFINFVGVGCGSAGKSISYNPSDANPAATVDFDNSYVVLALNSIWIKQNTQIKSGNVGADPLSAVRPLRKDAEVFIAQNTVVTNKVFGNRIYMAQKSKAGSTYFNTGITAKGTGTSKANIGVATTVNATYFPLFPNKPVLKTGSGTYPNTTLIVKKNQPQTLTAGANNLGTIQVNEGAVLTFNGGTYYMKKLVVNSKGELRFNGPTSIIVRDQVNIKAKALINATETVGAQNIKFYVAYPNPVLAGSSVDGDEFDEDGDWEDNLAVLIGNGSTVKANFMATFGTIWLKHNSVFSGALYGKDVIVGHDVVMTNANGLMQDDNGNPLNPNDVDDDAIPNASDNCPTVPNHDQSDIDGDGFGNACDNCAGIRNILQEDTNQNGIGNACEAPAQPYCGNGVRDISAGEQCDDGNASDTDACHNDCTSAIVDSDNDGIPDTEDNCPNAANTNQLDSDHDGFGDACDTGVNGPALFSDFLSKVMGVNFDPNSVPDLSTSGCIATAAVDGTKYFVIKDSHVVGNTLADNISVMDGSALRYAAQSPIFYCVALPSGADTQATQVVGGLNTVNQLITQGQYASLLNNSYASTMTQIVNLRQGLAHALPSTTFDIDNDGVNDLTDNCPWIANPGQETGPANQCENLLLNGNNNLSSEELINLFISTLANTNANNIPVYSPYLSQHSLSLASVDNSKTYFVLTDRKVTSLDSIRMMSGANVHALSTDPYYVMEIPANFIGPVNAVLSLASQNGFSVNDPANLSAISAAQALSLSNFIHSPAFTQLMSFRNAVATALNIPNNDWDSDGVMDTADNCPIIANAGQEDADNNGIGDVCETAHLVQLAQQLNLQTILNQIHTATGITIDPSQINLANLSNVDLAAMATQLQGANTALQNANIPSLGTIGSQSTAIQNALASLGGSPDVMNQVKAAYAAVFSAKAALASAATNYTHDNDNDGFNDLVDNCPSVANADQADLDGNHVGDVCELDAVVAQAQQLNLNSVVSALQSAGITLPTLPNIDPNTPLPGASNLSSILNQVQSDIASLQANGFNTINLTQQNASTMIAMYGALTPSSRSQVESAYVGLYAARAQVLAIFPAGSIPAHDTDNDGVDDKIDNCITISNAPIEEDPINNPGVFTQPDADHNGVGDACDFNTMLQQAQQAAAQVNMQNAVNGLVAAGVPLPDAVKNFDWSQANQNNLPALSVSDLQTELGLLSQYGITVGNQLSTQAKAAYNNADSATQTKIQQAYLGVFTARSLVLSALPPAVFTQANITDTDTDGVMDLSDNCWGIANSSQADADSNGIGDACELATLIAQ